MILREHIYDGDRALSGCISASRVNALFEALIYHHIIVEGGQAYIVRQLTIIRAGEGDDIEYELEPTWIPDDTPIDPRFVR